MKILATQSATLTNYEVLAHLTSTRAKTSLRARTNPTTSSMKSPNLETVTKEVRLPLPSSFFLPIPPSSPLLNSSHPKPPTNNTPNLQLTDYLSPAPTTNPPPPLPPYATDYDTSTIKILLTRLKPYDLTKAELLMILNLRPMDMGLLDCVIEECDMRFSAEEQEEILGVVGEVLGGRGEGENEEGDGIVVENGEEDEVENGHGGGNGENEGGDV
ncbi:hypothetical protein MMC08_007903 [Hypocenomyce scalaris]|nr:hypothetical protein [Hypocenomyce scalaris]